MRSSQHGSGQDRIGGQFKSGCGCINHELYIEGIDDIIIRKITSVKHRKSYKVLVEKDLISKRAKNVCSACLDFESKLLQPVDQLDETESEETIDDSSSSSQPTENCNSNYFLDSIIKLKEAIKNKKWHLMSYGEQRELSSLAGEIGKSLNQDILRDSKSISGDYRNIDYLKDINATEWLSHRNTCVVEFLSNATGVDANEERIKKLNGLTHLIEQVLHTRNLNVVTPFSFKRNLLLYSITNSKIAVKLQSAWESSGSYTTVHEILTSKANPVTCPEGDVHNTIDNNQKVGMRTWRIREASTVPVSICTTLGHILPQPLTRLQYDEGLKPKFWLHKKSLGEIIADVNALEKQALCEFRKYRAMFIDETIQQVGKECIREPYVHDYVDIAVANSGSVNTCCKCQHTYNKEATTCSHCGNNNSVYNVEYDPYYRTAHNHPKEPPKVSVGEPCMVNPCSIETVRTVMQHVQSQTHLHETDHPRKWTYFHSDGVPYVYAADIQDYHLKCSECNEEVNSKGINKVEWESFLLQHKESHEHSTSDFHFDRIFDDLLIIPGPGHIEMNMAKLLLKFLWEPFLCDFSKKLGFRTPKALQVVKNGVDHHRSRIILKCALESLSKELLVPYVRECQVSNKIPNDSGYIEFVKNVKNENYEFLYHVTFSYLLGFHLYNEAVRKNHSLRMLAARCQIAPLFYSFHHPKYQQLHLRDLCMRVQMPTELQIYQVANESFSASGIKNRGQGADFIHEEINKLVKSFLPPGLPTNETWERVCRKATELRDMKLKAIGFVDFVEKKSAKKSDNVTTMMRREIRSKMLNNAPLADVPLTSITGNTLDESLTDIKYIAKENYEHYKENYKNNLNFSCKILKGVYMTQNERIEAEKIENRLKSDIKKEIKSLLAQLPDKTSATEMQNSFLKNEKRLKHQQLVDFYYSVKTILDEQNASLYVDGDEEALVEI